MRLCHSSRFSLVNLHVGERLTNDCLSQPCSSPVKSVKHLHYWLLWRPPVHQNQILNPNPLPVYLLWRPLVDHILKDFPSKHNVAAFANIEFDSMFVFKVRCWFLILSFSNDAND
jgi:hypothetical protein